MERTSSVMELQDSKVSRYNTTCEYKVASSLDET